MQITVKVKPQAGKKPAAVVRLCVTSMQPDAKVEEVFPDVKTGRRAGLVSVELPDTISDEASDALLASLRAQDDVEYAEPAAPRRSR